MSLSGFPVRNKRLGPMYATRINHQMYDIIVGCDLSSDPIGDHLPQAFRFAYMRAATKVLSEELAEYYNLSPRHSDNLLAVLSRGATATLIESEERYGIKDRPEIQEQLAQQLRQLLSRSTWTAPKKITALHLYLYHSFLRQNGVIIETKD